MLLHIPQKGVKREDIVYCLKNLGGKRGGRCQMTEGRWQPASRSFSEGWRSEDAEMGFDARILLFGKL
jgi:hypothetical protein